MTLWKDEKISYGEQDFLVKFKEHNSWITVQLHSVNFPNKRLNRNCEHMGFHLLGKKNLITSAIHKYNTYVSMGESM